MESHTHCDAKACNIIDRPIFCRKCAYCSKRFCSNHSYLIYRTFLANKSETIIEHDIICELCVVNGLDLHRASHRRVYACMNAVISIYLTLFGDSATNALTREDIILKYMESDTLLTKAARS